MSAEGNGNKKREMSTEAIQERLNKRKPYGDPILGDSDIRWLMKRATELEKRTRKKREDLFKKGDRVRYVPDHAEGNINSPFCEDGAVSSVGEAFVFVKYDNNVCVMVTGDEPYTAAATNPRDLVKI